MIALNLSPLKINFAVVLAVQAKFAATIALANGKSKKDDRRTHFRKPLPNPPRRWEGTGRGF
jgi:hypothetical protein